MAKNQAKRQTRAKNVPLVGMEDIRISALDDICSTLSDVRETMNAARGDEKKHLKTALGLMRTHRKQSWRAHGVELVRVPGEEKIRCRTSKEPASAEMESDDDDWRRSAQRNDSDGPPDQRPSTWSR